MLKNTEAKQIKLFTRSYFQNLVFFDRYKLPFQAILHN